MSDKPEALRLAESAHLGYRIEWQVKAAAELRRLHAIEVQYEKMMDSLYSYALDVLAKATGGDNA